MAALVRDGKEVSELKKGESGAVVLNQTPFYGESGGQVGDTGEMRREGVRLAVTDTQKKAGDVFAHQVKVEQGAREGRRSAAHGSRSRAPRRHPAEPFRHPSAARGAAPGARRSRGAEGLAGRARPAALRLLASQADDRGRDRAGRGHRQRHRAAECPGHHAADGARGCPRLRRARAVRREIRRRGARGGDGRGRRLRQHARLVGRAVRRHPCQAHRRYRPDQRPQRFAAWPPACAGSRRSPAKWRARPPTSRFRWPRSAAAELKVSLEDMPARLAALLEERKKLERELADARKKLAHGRRRPRPRAPTTACARSTASS